MAPSMPKTSEARWEFVKELDSGGQGTTYLVKSKERPSQVAVLKKQIEERAKDLTSRQRMNNEVSNLQTASSTNAKVPKVFESNTHEFPNTDVELYFVMEYIAGESLKDLMNRDKQLTVEEAYDLVIDLSQTLLACHQKSIMHRDLKPGNIIIRRRKPMDGVIVDYGLSFNEQETETHDLTSDGEPIGNGFTDLPERRTPDAQRNYETDLTMAMGILYHCISGQRPVPWRDAHGLPPHRSNQPGKSLREAMKGHPSTDRLEIVFDGAYQPVISERFRDAKELIDRLLHARAATGGEQKKLGDLLKERSTRLVNSSRTLQLQRYAKAAEQVFHKVREIVGEGMTSESHYQLVVSGNAAQSSASIPSDLAPLGIQFVLSVRIPDLDESSAAEYAFAAKGTQTAILCRRTKKAQPVQTNGTPRAGRQSRFQRGRGSAGGGMGGFGGDMIGGGGFGMPFINPDTETAYIASITGQPVEPEGEWEVKIWYQGEGQPNEDELRREITECVEMQIDDLQTRIT
jgi:serine/threonine protein kinase